MLLYILYTYFFIFQQLRRRRKYCRATDLLLWAVEKQFSKDRPAPSQFEQAVVTM